MGINPKEINMSKKRNSKKKATALKEKLSKEIVDNSIVETSTEKVTPEVLNSTPDVTLEQKSSGRDTTERENEKSGGNEVKDEVTKLEPSANEELSNGTPEVTTDDVTTAKVEPVVVEENPKDEVPEVIKQFFTQPDDRGITSSSKRDGVEIHSCVAFTDAGKPAVMKRPIKPKRANYKESDFNDEMKAYDKAMKVFIKKINERKEKLRKTIPTLMKQYGNCVDDYVHAWHNGKDKRNNVVGILKGFGIGKAPFIVAVEVIDEKGETKLVRRTFNKISLTLPVGFKVPKVTPLVSVALVEETARKEQKLLADKSNSKPKFLMPKGYNEAVERLQEGESCHIMLVWNNNGKQVTFFALPTKDDPNLYRWIGMDNTSEQFGVWTNAIRWVGTQESLLRTFILCNQSAVDSMAVIAINSMEHYGYFTELLANNVDIIGDTPKNEQESA